MDSRKTSKNAAPAQLNQEGRTGDEQSIAWEEVARFLQSYDSFLVVAHIQPDGDAIGSTLAMAHILQRLGKSYVLTNDSPVPKRYRFLTHVDSIVPWPEAKAHGHFEAVISVDCADQKRLGAVTEVIGKYPMLNIDHHPTNDNFGTVNAVAPEKAATAEILYDLTEYLQLAWDREFAEAIYTGVMTDTGSFRYANTSPAVMALAAHLLTYGVVPYRIAEHVYESVSQAQLLVTKEALNALSFAEDGRIAWMSVTVQQKEDTGATDEDLGSLVNVARNIEGVEVGILFKQIDSRGVKVSMRSRHKVDVAQIAQALGGGGHARAAGCYVEGTLPEVEARVIAATRRALNE